MFVILFSVILKAQGAAFYDENDCVRHVSQEVSALRLQYFMLQLPPEWRRCFSAIQKREEDLRYAESELTNVSVVDTL